MTLTFSQLWLLEKAARVGEAPDSSGDTEHLAGAGRVQQSDISSSGLGHSVPRLLLAPCLFSFTLLPSGQILKARPLFPYRDKVQMDHDIYI